MFGIRQMLAAVTGVLLLAGTASAAEIFTLSSSTFKDGAMLPKKAAGANKATHHYTFILIATDLDPKALPAGLTKLELFSKLEGLVKGSTGLVGLFKNPL